MADNSIVREALARGYSIDEIADKLSENAGFDPSEIRSRGYSSDEILGRLGYEAPKPESPSLLDRAKNAVSSLFSGDSTKPSDAYSMSDEVTGGMSQDSGDSSNKISMPGSVLDGRDSSVGAGGSLIAERGAPVTDEVYQATKRAFDAASPERRAAMMQQPGALGSVARAIGSMYREEDAYSEGVPTLQGKTNRIEDRRVQRAGQGYGKDAAAAEALQDAITGNVPGAASIDNSTYDWDTREQYKDSNVLERGLTRGIMQLKQGALGIHEAAGELLGADDYANAMHIARAKSELMDQAIGENKDVMLRNFEGAIASTISNLPGMALGIATGSEIPTLAVMGMQSFGDEYANGRQRNLNAVDAAKRASIFAAFEVIGEKFGLSDKIAGFRAAGRGANTNVLMDLFGRALVKEVPGEELTTLGQFLTDKVPSFGLNKESGMKEYLGQVADTFFQTVMQSTIMGGSGIAVGHIRRMANTGRYGPDLTDGLIQSPASIDAIARQSLDPDNAQMEFTGQRPSIIAPAARSATPADIAAAPTIDHAAAAAQSFIDAPITESAPIAADMPTIEDIEGVANGGTTQGTDAVLPAPGIAQGGYQLGGSGLLAPDSGAARGIIGIQPGMAAGAAEQDALAPFIKQREDGRWVLARPINNTAPEIVQQVIAELDRRNATNQAQPTTQPITNQGEANGLQVQGQEAAQEVDHAAIDAAAHEAATSPRNNLSEPTDAQKEAGNYKKGHLNFDGLDLTIENPVGSERRGTDPSGKPWSVKMTAHYGYLKRSEGADGDQVDVYLPEIPKAGSPVFVFDQYGMDGKFDEHKAVAGVATQAEAEKVYDAHFSDGSGPARRRSVTAMSASEFKKWATEGNTSNPLADVPSAQPVTAPSQGEASRSINRIKGGKLELTGFDAEEVKAAAKKLGLEVRTGNDGKMLVTASDRNGETVKIPLRTENKLKKALQGKTVRQPKPRQISGNLRNDLNLLYPGLYREVENGGDGEATGKFDLGAIAEELRDEYGYTQIPQGDAKDAGEALIDLIRQGGAVNEERMLAEKQAEEQKAYRDGIYKDADEFGIPRVARKFSDIEAAVLKVRRAELEKEIEILGERYQALRDKLAEYRNLDEIDAMLDGIANENEGAHISVLYRALGDKLEDAINEEITRTEEADAAADQTDGEDRGAGSTGAQGREAERPAFDLEIHSREDLAAKDARANDQALADKETADQQREAFSLSAPAGSAAPKAAPSQQAGLFSANGEAVKSEEQAPAERFEIGRSLTKEQKKSVLKTLVDVYKANDAPKEFKGLDQNGNERYGYAYSPEFFVKSDITGAMVRYHVTLPDGRIAHPTELFPEYSQSDIDAELERQKIEERNKKADDEFRLKTLNSRKSSDLNEANRIFWKQNPGLAAQSLEYHPALLTNGTEFVRTDPAYVERDLKLLGDGWREKKFGEGDNAKTPADAGVSSLEARHAALDPQIDALTDDEAIAVGKELGIEYKRGQDMRAKIKEAHPDDQERALKAVKVGVGGTATEFIKAPDGSIDFGEITANQAKTMRRQAGKIRLTRGVQNADGTGHGLVHIEANHGKQIRGAGFGSVEEFIAHVAKDFGQIWQATGSQLLAAYRDGQQHMMYVQLEPASDESGDFYRVNSAFPVRQEDYPEKHGFKKLWDGSEPASAVAGKQPAFAGNPEVQSGQDTPNARGQSSTNIADPQAEGKIESAREPKTGPYTMSEHADLIDRLHAGTLTIDEFKQSFDRLRASKSELTAELQKLTKDKIMKVGNLPTYWKNDPKEKLVRAAADGLIDAFDLRDTISYVMGQREATVARLVAEATQETLDKYAEKRKARVAEFVEQRKAMIDGVKNPQTIDDFQNYIRLKKSDGMSFAEARMTLTPEQRAKFDDLVATQSRDARQARADQQKTDVRVAAATTEGQIIETKHTRTGEPLFVVKAAERVERDVYNQWNATARKLGGHYSAFRGNGAVPGFQFKTRENADAFLKYIGGNVDQAKEAVQARRDAFDDDKNQTAIERLREMADRIEESADESLGQERKANTARRARFAAAAESAANADKAMAQTMRNIAQAIESGAAKFLDRVRQKVQVEMLNGFVRSAQDAKLRKLYPSYLEQERHQGEAPNMETADYAEFPQYTAFRSDLAKLGRQMLAIDGAKKLGKQILAVADDVSDAYLAFAKENLHRVSTFSRGDGQGATFASRDDAEAAIWHSGLRDKAIVLPVKRGQNVIIQSPTFARENGIWQGDDDKRITLSAEIGAAIVAKNKEFAKRLDMPYTFEYVAEKQARLKAMGIETPAEFRSMLREFIGLKQAPKALDRVKELERSMVGRKNDGLDFFPTPADTVRAMLDAAELKEGMSVLEPSAGMGHIADMIRDAGVEPDVVELSNDRKELLEAKGYTVVGRDFMDMNPRGFTYGDVFKHKDGRLGVMRGSGSMGSGRVGFHPLDANGNPDARNFTWEDREDLEGVEKRGSLSGYDRILMNPPFGDRRDAQHVQHAYDLLAPGGRLVAIMGEGSFFGQDKKAQEFRDWLDSVGGTSEKLDEGTFLDPSLSVNTGVNARMVVIDKPKSGEAMFSRANQNAPVFYSQLAKAIADAPAKIDGGTAAQWRMWLMANSAKLGVKKDELQWTGITDWLEAQGKTKLSKADIAAYLDQGGVKVEEVTLGETDKSARIDAIRNLKDLVRSEDDLGYESNNEAVNDLLNGSLPLESVDVSDEKRDEIRDAIREYNRATENPTKYHSYQLPGGENYRELLLTLPDTRKRMTENATWEELHAEQKRVDQMERSTFRSSHFDQSNILAHVRFNERTDAEGRRVLFIEEVQSDWGQKGKKEGFKQRETKKLSDGEWQEIVNGWKEELAQKWVNTLGSIDLARDAVSNLPYESVAKMIGKERELADLESRNNDDYREQHGGFVPSAPFVTDTKAWTALALKRMIRYAVDNGFEAIAWTTGEQQASRYDLSKQVDSILYHKNDDGSFAVSAITGARGNMMGENISPDKLEDYVGKEIAKKIIDGEGKRTQVQGSYGYMNELSGVDLKVGGEGMKGYYDAIVPQVMRDVLKQLGGGNVENIAVDGVRKYDDLMSESDALASQVYGRGTTYTELPAESQAKIREMVKSQRTTQPGIILTDAIKEKAAQGMPLFARLEHSNAVSKRIHAEDLTAVTKRARSAFQGVPFHILEDETQAPQSLRDQIEEAGAQGDVAGAYHEGEIYLFRSGIRDIEHAEHTVLHEVEHAGLRSMFGADLHPVMLDINKSNLKVRDKAFELAKKYGYSTVKATEEALADMGPEVKKLKGWDRLVAWVRDKLRSVGLVKEWTDKDIEALVLRAIEAMKKPAKTHISGGTMFSGDVSSLVSVFRKLADFDETARFPRSHEKDMAKLAGDLSPQLEVGEPSEQSKRVIGDDGSVKYEVTERQWPASATDGSPVYITEEVPNKHIYINVSELKEGMSEGSLIYQLVGQYAANNGLIFIGDPNGITNGAIYRRTENMIALALKLGTTEFMAPHEDQMQAVDGMRQGEEFFWPGFEWKTGDHANNLHNMLMASYTAIKHYVPEIADVVYDPRTMQYRDARTGQRIPDSRFGSWANSPGGRKCHAGRTTLKRAALVNSVVSGALSESEWSKSLNGLVGGEVAESIKWASLKDIRYSRTNQKTPALAGVSASGPTVAPPIPNNAQQSMGLQGGQTGAQAWDIGEKSPWNNFIYKYQNKYVDLKDTIAAIQKTGQQIRDAYDPYLQEELYHKRVGKRTSDFFENEFKPLLVQMRMNKVSREALEEYLLARHAKEANALIRDRGGMADGGSGMTDKEADDYFAKLSAEDRRKYEALARRIDTMIAGTRATLVHYGLESKETVDEWAKMFQHYVPLYREDMDEGQGIGQGFSVKGPASKHRTGSSRKVADILANIAQQRDRAIVRGEKNRVAVALYGLAFTNPNPDVWEVDRAPQKQTLDKNGQITTAIDPLYKSRPNVIVARIKGKDGRVHDRAIVFNDRDERAKRMVEALKNLDAQHLEGAIGLSSKVTRYVSAMSTQYNPVFVAVNFARDFQTVALNLSSTPLAGMQREVSMNALSAMRGIFMDLRAARSSSPQVYQSKWAALYEEMQLEGGTTGYREMFANATERTAEQVEKLLDPEWWTKTGWGKALTAGGILKAPEQWLVSKPGAAMMNWLSDMNETSENAMRLAVYKTALDHGISKQRAASLAKNISVNFNRKGQVGAQMNALYAFFNAAVQGTARMYETLSGPAGKRIIYGGILLGVMQAFMLAAAGFDDDDPPDFVRERSLIIPLGGKRYLTIPMPLGFHVLPNLGRIPAELAMRGLRNPGKAIAELLGVIAGAFNPVGGGDWGDAITPTPADPVVALWRNKDWTGRKIYREDFNKLKPTPGFTRAKDTASGFSKWVAEVLNKVSGGTEYSPGWMSPTPDQIDYLLGQATGGVGREALKVWQAGESIYTGEELPAHKVPLVGRFYGNAEGQSHEAARFYENLKDLGRRAQEIQGRRKDGKSTAGYMAENPDARLAGLADNAEKQVAFLRRQKRKMIDRKASKEDIKRQEEKITAAMKRFNDAVARRRSE